MSTCWAGARWGGLLARADGESPARTGIALVLPIRDGGVLVARRPEGRHLAGFWEFPGGKIERGEDPEVCARRELAEETGLAAGPLEPLTVLFWDYPDRLLRIHVYLARDCRGPVTMRPRGEWGWKSPAELETLEMPEANRPILRALRFRLGAGDS